MPQWLVETRELTGACHVRSIALVPASSRRGELPSLDVTDLGPRPARAGETSLADHRIERDDLPPRSAGRPGLRRLHRRVESDPVQRRHGREQRRRTFLAGNRPGPHREEEPSSPCQDAGNPQAAEQGRLLPAAHWVHAAIEEGRTSPAGHGERRGHQRDAQRPAGTILAAALVERRVLRVGRLAQGQRKAARAGGGSHGSPPLVFAAPYPGRHPASGPDHSVTGRPFEPGSRSSVGSSGHAANARG